MSMFISCEEQYELYIFINKRININITRRKKIRSRNVDFSKRFENATTVFANFMFSSFEKIPSRLFYVIETLSWDQHAGNLPPASSEKSPGGEGAGASGGAGRRRRDAERRRCGPMSLRGESAGGTEGNHCHTSIKARHPPHRRQKSGPNSGGSTPARGCYGEKERWVVRLPNHSSG